MYLNFKNYEKKYIKYKCKYKRLKSQIYGAQGTLLPKVPSLNGGAKGTLLPKVPSLNGGDCLPLPNPEEEDMTAQNLLDLCPDAKGTFRCL
jgi:hypothetical protein